MSKKRVVTKLTKCVCDICHETFESVAHNSKYCQKEKCQKEKRRLYRNNRRRTLGLKESENFQYSDLPEETINNIIEDYIEGKLGTIEITKKYNVREGIFGYIKRNFGLENRRNVNETINIVKKRFDISDILIVDNKVKAKINCSDCKKEHIIKVDKLKRISGFDNKYLCLKCIKKSGVVSVISAQVKIKKSNTTGYIGTSIKKRGDKAVGYTSALSFKKRRIFYNTYPDHDLHESTLIQAAVDRDLFIIEKELPHTRNFTDKELYGEMLKLGYKQAEDIKKLLENKIEG